MKTIPCVTISDDDTLENNRTLERQIIETVSRNIGVDINEVHWVEKSSETEDKVFEIRINRKEKITFEKTNQVEIEDLTVVEIKDVEPQKKTHEKQMTSPKMEPEDNKQEQPKEETETGNSENRTETILDQQLMINFPELLLESGTKMPEMLNQSQEKVEFGKGEENNERNTVEPIEKIADLMNAENTQEGMAR